MAPDIRPEQQNAGVDEIGNYHSAEGTAVRRNTVDKSAYLQDMDILVQTPLSAPYRYSGSSESEPQHPLVPQPSGS